MYLETRCQLPFEQFLKAVSESYAKSKVAVFRSLEPAISTFTPSTTVNVSTPAFNL
ncbi:MAG: hypothetical protein CM15mP109_07200 [Candidatus Dadabacteria bacterium]|nr:MAG: hypothetical protein CM15mP109_07200 [Candidatus Dadabacteria bacterium]